MKKLLYIFVLIFVLFSCKNDDDFTKPTTSTNSVVEMTNEQFLLDNFGSPIEANFIGRIVNQTGNKLKDVQITIGNQTTMTDHNGVFVLNNASVHEKFAFIKASKNGYIQGSRTLVPVPNGTNDVQITLLDKNIVGTVNSGEASEVSLPNGAKVQFQGSFIDASGNPYNGQVQVSLHYLEPNQQGTFTQMPGMLFGQRENGSASGMETYGMVGVNLYSSAGEQLNILKTAPATVTFPVATSTPNAPETIPLWYFDEGAGYWKEQGIAVKTGNEYIAEVTHFTWWNCDMSVDVVNVCFELRSHGALPNFYFEIIRDQTNQLMFSGYTNDNGQECVLFPVGEEVTINIYGDGGCVNTIIHTAVLGPYSNDISIDIIVPSLPSQLIETSLTGTVSTCTGTSVTNGYLFLYNSSASNLSDVIAISITDGIINTPFSYCNNEQYSMIVYDLDTNQSSGVSILPLNSTEINIGTLLACGNQVGGTFVGGVTLTSQEEVDAFGLLGYEVINGGLVIGVASGASNIVNINSLSSLHTINGALNIKYNPNLTNLNGIENITYARALSIWDCDSLTGVLELSNINITVSNGYLSIWNNASLVSLEGLEGITSFNFSYIQENPSLINLNGLDNITNVTVHITIVDNMSLVSLSGLENLTQISTVRVGVNQNGASAPNINLTDFCALQNLYNNDASINTSIANNGFNPTVQNIIDGNCSQ